MMIVAAYWRPGTFAIVSTNAVKAEGFASRLAAAAHVEKHTTRIWQGFKLGWRVEINL